jgi:hypothetical protein
MIATVVIALVSALPVFGTTTCRDRDSRGRDMVEIIKSLPQTSQLRRLLVSGKRGSNRRIEEWQNELEAKGSKQVDIEFKFDFREAAVSNLRVEEIVALETLAFSDERLTASLSKDALKAIIAASTRLANAYLKNHLRKAVSVQDAKRGVGSLRVLMFTDPCLPSFATALNVEESVSSSAIIKATHREDIGYLNGAW